jgi:hypothetical protein
MLTTLALTTAAQASDIRHLAADVPTPPAQVVPLPDDDPDEDVDNAKPYGPAGSTVRIEDEPETAPLYVNARGSIAVPANGNGDVAAAGAGMGIVLKDNQQLGLRFIYMHQPPSNPLSSTTPEVPWAWGAVSTDPPAAWAAATAASASGACRYTFQPGGRGWSEFPGPMAATTAPPARAMR